MATAYSFVTKWKINAPIAQVWDAIYDTGTWPEWWRGVISVKKIKEGDEHGVGAVHDYRWRSLLPYKLHFTLEVTETTRHEKMVGIAQGELVGTGIWQFEERDGITHASNYWDVDTEKKWMNAVSFLLKPVFAVNHRISMRWGAEGLAKKLGVEVVVER